MLSLRAYTWQVAQCSPTMNSYCNSIIQCLYYSVPFREQVINFPKRSPLETLVRPPTALPRINTDLSPAGKNATLSATKSGQLLSSPNQASPRKLATAPGAPVPQGPKPEDNKDSPEYKKKLAMAAGPILNMDYENSSSYGMKESLFTSLKDIFEAIIAHRSRIGVVSPNKFLEILRRDNEMFRTAMHQDAHEFLNLLLNEVVENVEQFSKQMFLESGGQNGSANYGLPNAFTSVVSATIGSEVLLKSSTSSTGWVHELFEGTLTSETRCLTCENTSQRDEAFLDLSVDLEQHSSVTSCLRKFSEEEMLCERNKFHCDNCGGLQEAEKRMKIKRLPRILALHLKRFKYTEDLQRLQKLFHRVVYPYHLRLFNTTDDAEDPDRLYELYAVVVHIGGGPYHGHYVSIIKTQDRGWLLFDDEMVEPVDKSYVRNFFGGEGVLACAYVLFYQETTLEAMQREQEAEGLAAAKRATDVSEAGKQNDTLPNGHPTHIVTTPVVEDSEFIHPLDHATTAPPSSLTPHTPLQPSISSPPLPLLSPKKSNLQAKKAKAQEERERRATEKEQERVAKEKRKEIEQTRRDNHKKQEDELRAAIAASKATKAEEDKRNNTFQDEGRNSKENGHGIIGSGLNRFRQSSMSLRQKPKFWSTKDKQDNGPRDVTNAQNPASTESTLENIASSPNPIPDKKHRFSLGKKKSSILP